jgi:hypothetical protein
LNQKTSFLHSPDIIRKSTATSGFQTRSEAFAVAIYSREDVSMDQENQDITLAVLDSANAWIAESLDENTVLTIIALISEDPTNWQEALSVWPRYRSSAVCETTSELPFEEIEPEAVLGSIQAAAAWVFIDFTRKRLSTGGHFEAIDRDAEFRLEQADDSDFTGNLTIHLPPWWDLVSDAAPVSLLEARPSPIARPIVDREILYGDAFLTFVARRALEVFHSDDWTKCVEGNTQRDRYALTVESHKDWLMTPREDLGGRIPRQMLHGAIQWNRSAKADHISDHLTKFRIYSIEAENPWSPLEEISAC